jgi:iron complex transport system substrate-binding protein
VNFRPRETPRRIVCLTEEPTEILYALGEGERVVGISAWTKRPPEAREKPIVSAFVGGSVEKIVALEPDLVIGFSDIQARLASELIAANLQVLVFNQRSIQEILEVILAVARIVGREAQGRELVAGYLARLEAAAARSASRASRLRVYFEEWPDPMISGIRWVSELIEVAGGIDIFADRSSGRQAKDRFVTSAEVIERAPEVILASWCGKPFDPESLRARAGWGRIPAVVSGRLHEIDSCLILQPGPACLTDGLDALERLLA